MDRSFPFSVPSIKLRCSKKGKPREKRAGEYRMQTGHIILGLKGSTGR